jgi:D-alanyl-D-alanine carboxypeptidase
MTRLRAVRGRFVAALASVAVTATLLGCTAPAESDAGQASQPAWQGELETAFVEALDEAGVPGGALAVTRDDVRFDVTTGVADLADGAAFTAEDISNYRSITKSFVATVILQLVDDGTLGLDDAVSRYVPGVPRGDEITIRELAAMRSGLANYSSTPALGEQLNADPLRTWTDDELLAIAFAEPLQFEPGTSYEYSNTNTVLLGRVIEAVTGTAWDVAVAERILAPLAMESVAFRAGPLAVEPYELGDGTPELFPPVSATMFSAAGGLSGTIGDLDRWAAALGSAELLSTEQQSSQLADMSDTSVDHVSPYYDAYGLGIGRLEDWIGHTGTGLGYQALAMYDPSTGTSVAILINATGDDPDLPAHIFVQDLLSLLAP